MSKREQLDAFNKGYEAGRNDSIGEAPEGTIWASERVVDAFEVLTEEIWADAHEATVQELCEAAHEHAYATCDCESCEALRHILEVVKQREGSNG